MKRLSIIRRSVCLMTSLSIMATYSVYPMPKADHVNAQSAEQNWETQISQMLQSGDYEEGTVETIIQYPILNCTPATIS